MSAKRKRVDSLIGTGLLKSSQGQSFEVEYELRTYRELIDGEPGPMGADGAVMTLDPKPWIPPGEQLALVLEDGSSVRVVNREPFTTDEWCLIDVAGEIPQERESS
jgi:hypothetical protein